MPRRKLIKGDRVKITGHWDGDASDSRKESTEDLVGKYATVDRIRKDISMSIVIEIDGIDGLFFWDRENLRALPKLPPIMVGSYEVVFHEDEIEVECIRIPKETIRQIHDRLEQ